MTAWSALKAGRRSWWIVALFAVLGAAAGLIGTSMMPTVYRATTVLSLSTTASSVTDLSTGASFSQQAVRTYANLVTTSSILDPAIERAGLRTTSEELAPRVTASVTLNTSLLTISVDGDDRAQTIAVTQAISDLLIEEVNGSLEPAADDPTSSVTIAEVQKVSAPEGPVGPRPAINVLAGLLAGLVLGIAVAALREFADDRVRSAADLRQVTDAPILGAVLRHRQAGSRPLVVVDEPLGAHAEAFRALRMNLQHLEGASGSTLLLASAMPSEGTTTTAANLALAIAAAGKRVCLVDADLRRPGLSRVFGVDGRDGLTDALRDGRVWSDLVQWPDDRGLAVLSAGTAVTDPSELLGSDRMKTLLRELEDSFDLVLVDGGALLPVTDAAVLSQSVSGVLLVGGVHRVTTRQLRAALGRLSHVRSTVFGIVLVKVSSVKSALLLVDVPQGAKTLQVPAPRTEAAGLEQMFARAGAADR